MRKYSAIRKLGIALFVVQGIAVIGLLLDGAEGLRGMLTLLVSSPAAGFVQLIAFFFFGIVGAICFFLGGKSKR